MGGKHIHEFMVSVTTSEDFSKGPIFAVVFVKRIDKGEKKALIAQVWAVVVHSSGQNVCAGM